MNDKRMPCALTKPKVLLIDDSYVTHVLIDGLMEDLNVDIVKYSHGKDAARFYRQHSEDIVLVLLDICLPDCTGWDLCQQLKKINNRVPVIAVSAVVPVELQEKCDAAGFTAYISKPVDVSEFLVTIKRFL